MRRVLGVVVGVVLGAGCASTSRFGGASSLGVERFPKRNELTAVALREPKLDLARAAAEPVDEWTLAGPFPTVAEASAVAAPTAWESTLVSGARDLRGLLSEDHRCIAREYARYVLAKRNFPGHSLAEFIKRRCGTTGEALDVRMLHGDVDDALPEAKWLEAWGKQLPGEVAGLRSRDLVGVAAARAGGRGVVVVVGSERRALLSAPVPLVGPGLTKVEVRGHLVGLKAERVSARINQGERDSAPCKALGAARPPEFAFECEVQAGDARTTISVAAFEPGRLLGRGVAVFTLWPGGEARTAWRRPVGGQDVAPGAFTARFISAINELRRKAGLAPLQEAPAQSTTARALAPHYFAAVLGQGDALDADTVALGMMAGWDVGIDVVSAGFGSEWLSGTRDLGVYLEFCLDDPWQRKLLFEPRATHVAVGDVERDGATALAALFATYVPLGAFDRKESEIAIITRLNRMRRDRGLPLAQWTLWPRDEGARVERELRQRTFTPDAALQHVLEATAEVSRERVQGYVQLVDDLDNFQFPPEVLLRPDINVFLAVGIYRGEDWAHSRYVVCFVVVEKGAVYTAAR